MPVCVADFIGRLPLSCPRLTSQSARLADSGGKESRVACVTGVIEETGLASGSGPALRLDPADGEQDPKQDRLGPRGTARHIDVDRQDLVDASRAGIAGRGDAARAGARADGDDDARLRNRLEGAAHGRLEVARAGPGHDDAVGVARGSHEVDAEAANVVMGSEQGHELPVARIARAGVEVAEMAPVGQTDAGGSAANGRPTSGSGAPRKRSGTSAGSSG